MEEVDNIIIESLKNINCSIDEDITSIKQFNPDLVIDAISHCLETIIPQVKYPHKLPVSMSSRLKLATNLAESIRELGFRGEIGYQSILYCNEVELRRVLMFLIERLPRESDENLPIQELGRIQQLKRKINENVRLCLTKSWIPVGLLGNGSRKCGNSYLQQSFLKMYPLKTKIIQMPQSYKSFNENFKLYWVNSLLDVTKQCSEGDLIPSLLFNDINLRNVNFKSRFENVTFSKENQDRANEINNTVIRMDMEKISEHNNSFIADAVEMKRSLNAEGQKLRIKSLQDEIESNRAKLIEVLNKKKQEENKLNECITQYKIKSKTLLVLSEEENLIKLENLVQNGNNKLEMFKLQWKEIQIPLLQEYDELKENSNEKDTKIQEKLYKIKEIRGKNHQLVVDIQNKEKIERQLKEECEKFNKTTGRSSYTKRIMEIISNIIKQNCEIQKILDDTKRVQKEINNLNGQLERSFTLSDELIFRNAIQDETSRRAYKLLATLHNDCGAAIQSITDLGLAERESRNLQEQIDSEVIKSYGVSLERVNADLANVRREIDGLNYEKNV